MLGCQSVDNTFNKHLGQGFQSERVSFACGLSFPSVETCSVASRPAIPRSRCPHSHTPERKYDPRFECATASIKVQQRNAENLRRHTHRRSDTRSANQHHRDQVNLAERGTAQLDSPLTEPVVCIPFESIDPLGLCRTNCPVLVFDSNGVITLESLLVCTVPVAIIVMKPVIWQAICNRTTESRGKDS